MSATLKSAQDLGRSRPSRGPIGLRQDKTQIREIGESAHRRLWPPLAVPPSDVGSFGVRTWPSSGFGNGQENMGRMDCILKREPNGHRNPLDCSSG